MAEPQTPEKRDAAEAKLFTLSEVSQRTGISMPTLQRYKKTYQDRIPSVGSGRKQRYPEHSLPVFEELRTENAGRRGRPRKSASAAATPGAGGRRAGRRAGARRAGRRPGRPAAARSATPARRRGRPPGRPKAARGARAAVAAATPSNRRGGRRAARGVRGRAAAGGKAPSGLLTLTEIAKTTGISYPTLVRYVRLYSDRLKHHGKGRARRFYPEAVAEFRALRQESGRGGRRAGRPTGVRRGRPPKSAAGTERLEAVLRQRLHELEKLQAGVQKRFGDLVRGLQKLL